MIINSYTEFDLLKSVLVGTATNANFPIHDMLFQKSMSEAGWTKTSPPKGRVPQYIIDETNEDLNKLAEMLTHLGVEVHRPHSINHEVPDFSKTVSTVDWETDGQYAYCPRDNLLVVGDMVIEAPMSTRARQNEVIAFDNIRRAAIKDGARWFSAPRPRLFGSENGLYLKESKLTEQEPVFDAANICRIGTDLIYLVSNTGNRLGAEWLQCMLGDKFTVHIVDVYDSAHIDSTIVPVAHKKVVLNASRVNDDNLPACFEDWDKIYITEDMINPQSFVGYPYASKWIAINMLALGNNRVICDANQPKIHAELEKHGMTVIPMELRHARTLGGGFHCVTLDLHRDAD